MSESPAQITSLLDSAAEAAKMAYAPYSGYNVGAALLCADGSIYTGCNVENASYSLTICAERTAIFKALSEGQKDFRALAIYVDSDTLFPPCGACRQVISEFSYDLLVVYGNKNTSVRSNIRELLPGAFNLHKV